MKKTLNLKTTTPAEVKEADTETILRTLVDVLEVDDMAVSVENTPVGTKVVVETNTGKDTRYNSLEMQMSREFINRYEDLLVDLYDIESTGLDLWWDIGEAFDSYGFDEITYSWFGMFGEPVGLEARDFEYADKIHSVFDSRDEIPDQEFSDETWVGRLAHTANSKKEAQNLVNAFDSKPSKRDIRLWKDVREMEDPELADVVEAAQRRFKAKYGYGEGTWIAKTKSMYVALGRDKPSEEAVSEVCE